jgi:hypothetical protein
MTATEAASKRAVLYTELLHLRTIRDGLLLKDRGTKNTARWKRDMRETTDALNRHAAELRELRKA